MRRRCHHLDHIADPVVFGECRACPPEAPRLLDLPRLLPSWVFVVPAERPYERVLGPDEMEG